MMKQVLGALLTLLGVAVVGWVGYCYLTGQPEIKEYSPIMPLVMSVAFIFVGVKWLGLVGGKKEESDE